MQIIANVHNVTELGTEKVVKRVHVILGDHYTFRKYFKNKSKVAVQRKVLTIKSKDLSLVSSTQRGKNRKKKWLPHTL